MSRPPPWSRPARSADDSLIKFAAGVIVASLLFSAVHWSRAARDADVRAITVEQERAQT